MKMSVKIISLILVLLMTFSAFAVPSFAAIDDEPSSLSFKTELLVDDGSGNWIKAEKLEHGQNVKARLYINTDYYAGAGNLVIFYNNDVFTDNYDLDYSNALVMNESATSTTKKYRMYGTFVKRDSSSKNFVSKMLTENNLTEDFINKHNAFTIIYQFASGSTCQKIDGSEWFAEFNLIVKDDSYGNGDFFIKTETIRSQDNDKAMINIAKGSQGLSVNEASSMHLWTPVSEVTSQPVKVNTYNIIYSFDGDAPCDAPASIPYAVTGDTVELPTFSPVEGWTFDGWKIVGATDGKVGTRDVSVIGKWIKNTYTVNFWLDIAQTELYYSKTYSLGDTVVNPENPSDSYFEAGTHFFDWNNDTINVIDNDTVDTYFIETRTGNYVYDICAITENDEYTANVYFVDVYGYENDVPVESIGSLNYGDKLYLEDMPETEYVDGYTFINWTVDGEVVDVWPITVTEDIDIYANFEAITYYATFVAEGGQWADGDTEKVLEFTYGEEIKAPEELPVREGYTFEMWDPDLGTMDIEDVYFYAFWSKNSYTLIYAVDGEENKIIYKYDDIVSMPQSPEKIGYTFIGWTYENGEKVEFPFNMPSGDVKIYASFEANSYDAVFMNDNIAFETKSFMYGEEISAPAGVPIKEGYDFRGWSLDGNDVITDFGIMSENGAKFFAVWKEKEPEHIHTPKEVVIDATCTEIGEKYTVCTSCGEKLSGTAIINALGHNPGEWEIVSNPTLNSDGKKIKKCLRCNEKIEETKISKLLTAIDSDTSVSVVYPPDDYDGMVSADAQISTDAAITDAVYTNVGPNKNTAYKIALVQNGQETAPKSTVKVSIPVPDKYNAKTSVIYFFDKLTGRIERINSTVEGGKLVFETDKLGYIVVVDTSKLAYVNAVLAITNPSTTTVKYGDTLILHAEIAEIPQGTKLEWSVTSGGGVRLSPDEENGMTCGVTSTSSSDVTVTVKLVDEDGNPVTDINGNEIFAEQKLKSKAGFFQKIISFFKNLFNMNRIIANAFKV